MLKYLPLAILIAVFYVIDDRYGPIGHTRFVGVLMLAFVVGGAFVRAIPFGFGRETVITLTGWAKLFVLVPAACLGLA
jgi:hypothetical protein